MYEEPAIEQLPWSASTFYGSVLSGSAAKSGKALDLGYQEIGGVRAHGHRWRGAIQCNFKELWISEDLKVDVFHRAKSDQRKRNSSGVDSSEI
jgi:hypothetical protein